MNKFNNGDLNFDIEKIISFDVPITVAKAFDDNLDYPYAIDVEDESYFYPDEESRNYDFDIFKEMIPNFSFVEDKIIVYTTESGTEYTFDKVLELAKGNKEYADLLLDRVEWQHIETLIDEDLMYGEIEQENGTYNLINKN